MPKIIEIGYIFGAEKRDSNSTTCKYVKKSRANLRLFKHGQTFLSQIRDSFQNTRLGLINLGL